MIYGYARVSLAEQNLDQQIYDLKAAGVQKIYAEKISTTKENRPKFEELLSVVKEGDSIYFTRFDRFARTALELLQEVRKLNEMKVGVKSLTQSWLDTTKDDPFTKFTFHLFAGIGELERELTRQRVKESLAYARSQGKFGGRKPLTREKQDLIAKLWNNGTGDKLRPIARMLDLDVKTIRKYCRTIPKKVE